MIADGRPGPAMASFLTEIIGLSAARINELRNAPRDYDALAVVSATMPREAQALAAVLPRSTLAVLDGQGHEAIDSAPDLLASRLAGFFRY
jgi:pimeloyl-ACP methyl ester carboxylesterase